MNWRNCEAGINRKTNDRREKLRLGKYLAIGNWKMENGKWKMSRKRDQPLAEKL